MNINPDNNKAFNQKFLNMDDVSFLDYIINNKDKTKIIKHVSVVTFKSYQFNKVPKLDMLSSNFTKLPAANQLSSTLSSISTTRLNPALMRSNPELYRIKDFIKPVEFVIIDEAEHEAVEFTFNNEKHYSNNMLLGSTFGRHFSDSYEVQLARSTWFTDRYYANFNYSITAGLGLRWPFQLITNT